MRFPWWRITAALVAISLLAAIARGCYLGAHPPMGQYGGMELAYEGIVYAAVSGGIAGVMVLLSFGMTETLGTGSRESLPAWLLGAGVGLAALVITFIAAVATFRTAFNLANAASERWSAAPEDSGTVCVCGRAVPLGTCAAPPGA